MNIRMIKLIGSLSPGLFPLMILKNLFGALTPYINLYMSAEIMNELAGMRDLNKLLFLTAATVAANLIASVLGGLFNKLYSDSEKIFYENERLVFTNNTLNMSYTDIENPAVHQLRREISNASMINAHGSGQFINKTNDLLNGFIEIILSFALFSQLFVLLVNNGINAVYIMFAAGIIICVVLHIFLKFYVEKHKSNNSMDFTRLNSYGQRINSGLNSYNMGKDIRLYRLDKIILKIKRDYMKLSEKSYNANNMFEFYTEIPEILLKKILQILSYIFVCILAFSKVIQIGGVLKYAGCIQRFLNAVSGIFDSVSELKYNMQFLDNYFKFLDIPAETSESGNERINLKSEYEIEFKDVSFKYPASENYALKNVSLKIKSGDRLAVVGMNGSGKTTGILSE